MTPTEWLTWACAQLDEMTTVNYPDTPEQMERRSALTEALYASQMESIAGHEESP